MVPAASPPVFAAGGTFAVGTAVRLVACVVHAYSAVGSGTRVTTREDLNNAVRARVSIFLSFSRFFLGGKWVAYLVADCTV
jgi:hypothetical protein